MSDGVRGDRGRAMVSAPGRTIDLERQGLDEQGFDVTDWTLAEVLEEVIERGLDPATVTVQYMGCGSHAVVLGWESQT